MQWRLTKRKVIACRSRGSYLPLYAGEEDDHGHFEASENLLSFTQAAAHEASSQNDDAGEQGVQPHLIIVLIQGVPDYKKEFRVKIWPNFDSQGNYKKIGFFLVIE